MSAHLKLSAADWCYLTASTDAAAYYRALKNLGYDAVEMATPDHHAAIRANGLELLGALGPGMTDGLNRRENHATLIPLMKETLRTAAHQGFRSMVVFSGNRAGQSDADGISHCLAGLAALLPVAEAEGVDLLFEMLCTADHADYQADSSAYGFRLVRELASTRIKVLYDIYHMHRMGESVLSDISDNLDIIGHIHIAGAPRRNAPGDGQEIDYPAMVPALIRAGYTGYWGMEFVPTGHALDELSAAATQWKGYAASAKP